MDTPLPTAKIRAFFGFKSIPFTKEIEPTKHLQTDALKEALNRLLYLVDRRGIGVVFGSPGSGKSTLLRALTAALGKSTHAVCYIDDTTCTPTDLYRLIAQGLQIQPPHRKGDIIQAIKARILKLSRDQRIRPVLIIDDAQRLPSPFLDEVRSLTSYDQDAGDHLTLILAGHPHLESSLKLAVNEPLAQRISIRVRLHSLTADEIEAYLSVRLAHAGRTAKLFLPDAVEAIAKGARGILRVVDQLAEQSILIAFARSRKEIDAEIVTAAVDEVDP
jgi:type II secretory pathway predicted ATPase ExeA